MRQMEYIWQIQLNDLCSAVTLAVATVSVATCYCNVIGSYMCVFYYFITCVELITGHCKCSFSLVDPVHYVVFDLLPHFAFIND